MPKKKRIELDDKPYKVSLELDNGKVERASGKTLYDAICAFKSDVMDNTIQGVLVMRHGGKELRETIFARQVKRLFGVNDIARRMLVEIYEQSL